MSTLSLRTARVCIFVHCLGNAGKQFLRLQGTVWSARVQNFSRLHSELQVHLVTAAEPFVSTEPWSLCCNHFSANTAGMNRPLVPFAQFFHASAVPCQYRCSG